MRRSLGWSFLLFLVACSGDDGVTVEGPEVCDDGVDNNGNGLVDCDDSEYCGGIRCEPTGDDDDDDDTTDLPDVEVDYPGGDIQFTFSPGNCPVLVKSFVVINRHEELEGTVDASCDLVDSVSLLKFQVDDGTPQVFVVDEALPAGAQMNLDMGFTCDTTVEFTTKCRVKGQVGLLSDLVEFNVTGTPL